MSEPKFRPLSSFEWASVSQYIVYISSAAGLGEINSYVVTSFPLVSLGPENLIVRKKRVKAQIERNIQKLEAFAENHKSDLEPAEISVLRSIYIQYKRDIETVTEHIKVAVLFQRNLQASLFLEESEKEEQDDFPF